MAKKMRDFTIKSDEVYKADQAIRSFSKEHPGALSDSDRHEFGRLLNNRAEALSKAFGKKVSSIWDD